LDVITTESIVIGKKIIASKMVVYIEY